MCTVGGEGVIVILEVCIPPGGTGSAETWLRQLCFTLRFPAQSYVSTPRNKTLTGGEGFLELGVRPKFAGEQNKVSRRGKECVGLGGLWIEFGSLYGMGSESTPLRPVSHRCKLENRAPSTARPLRMCTLPCCCLPQSFSVKCHSRVLGAPHRT